MTDLESKLRAIRAEVGYSEFDRAVKSLMRERLGTDKREKRIHWSKSLYQKLFDVQRGLCADCHQLLLIPSNKNHIDHYVPIAQGGTNNPSNLRLLHPGCNCRKNDESPLDNAKRTGNTIRESLPDWSNEA